MPVIGDEIISSNPIKKELSLGELPLDSGENVIRVTALSAGLFESPKSNEVTHSEECLSYNLKSDDTFEVTGLTDAYADIGVEVIRIPRMHEYKAVTSIRANAFSDDLRLKKVHIPASIIEIGREAFRGCSKLTDVTFNDSVSQLYYCTIYFRNTKKWTNIKLEEYRSSGTVKREMKFFVNNGEYDIYSISFIHSEVNAVGFSGYNSATGKEECSNSKPVSYLGYTNCWQVDDTGELVLVKKSDFVTPGLLKIGRYAFAETGVEEINLPRTLGYISDNLFSDCTKLTNISIPKYSVSDIGEFAFSSCTSLKEVEIPDGVINIGNAAFEDCDALTSVVIGNGVTSIGVSAFSHTGITSLIIPASVKNIGANMCDNCTSLTSVEINCSGYIGDYAFYNCAALATVNYGDSSNITGIGASAFQKTSMADSGIIIPHSVKWIGKKAFWECLADHARFENTYGWFYTTANSPHNGQYFDFGNPRAQSLYLASMLSKIENYAEMSWYRIEQMIAPTISLEGTVLTITDSTGAADSFKIYVGDVLMANLDVETNEITLQQ